MPVFVINNNENGIEFAYECIDFDVCVARNNVMNAQRSPISASLSANFRINTESFSMSTTFYVKLLPPEGDWSHGIVFTWEEAASILYSSPERSHHISWNNSRMHIDEQGRATWIVPNNAGTEKYWHICREHMNNVFTQALNGNTPEDDENT